MKNSLLLLTLVVGLLSSTVEAKEHKVHYAHAKKVSQKHVKKEVHTKKTNKIVNVKLTKKHNNLIGNASWYGYESGPKTASGAYFNPKKLTAAHRHIEFGTKVKVTNLKNNKSVIVTVNDRGPHVRGRIIDLSKAAAQAIDIKGVSKVSLNIVG